MINRFVRVLLVAAMVMMVRPASAASCASVASLALPNGVITSATLVAAGAFKSPAGMGFMMGGAGGFSPFKTMPAFCRVTATLKPTSDSDIKIEVWMPAQNWNGKLVGVGDGVWAGSIGYFSMIEPVCEGMQWLPRIRGMWATA